jgi:predicted small integral membrane protein
MVVERGSLIASLTCATAGLALGALWVSGLIGPLTAGIDLTGSIVEGSWMAWTWAGATFFAVIAALLIVMIVWGAVAPETPRHGALGIETTPGDRLFISLLGSAFIHLAWLAAFGSPLWGALALSLLYAAAVFRWV